MLREIRCERFRTNTIRFSDGLNVVLGDDNATNSIGKSSLLMVIDFAFGGSSLVEHNADAIKELGHHHYDIVFDFDGVQRRYRRGTLEPDDVYRCDEDFQPEAVLALDEYTGLLRAHYGIELEGLSFRALVGLYARVWGKENLDVMSLLTRMTPGFSRA
ncbi:MAG: ATP-binding protein [Gemmatimonadota bacterium]